MVKKMDMGEMIESMKKDGDSFDEIVSCISGRFDLHAEDAERVVSEHFKEVD